MERITSEIEARRAKLIEKANRRGEELEWIPVSDLVITYADGEIVEYAAINLKTNEVLTEKGVFKLEKVKFYNLTFPDDCPF